METLLTTEIQRSDASCEPFWASLGPSLGPFSTSEINHMCHSLGKPLGTLLTTRIQRIITFLGAPLGDLREPSQH